jgi:hypothetical protein
MTHRCSVSPTDRATRHQVGKSRLSGCHQCHFACIIEGKIAFAAGWAVAVMVKDLFSFS